MKISLDDNVIAFPAKERADLGTGRVLARTAAACSHYMTGYLVDEKLAEVTCQGCGEKLNPMWVLQQLTHKESRWHELHARYHEQLKVLAARSRCKCEHCKKMTRIER